MRPRLLKLLAAGAALVLVGVSLAEAQTPATAKPTPKRAKEFLFGGVVAGPSSVGTSTADLQNGTGDTSVTLFRVENKLASGFGAEANIGVQMSRSLWIEVSGGWTQSKLNSEIRQDFEDAFDETISSNMSRFTVEGGVVRYFRDRGKSALFVRVTAGWMRETAGGNTLTGDGVIGGAGLGWRHFWRTTGKGSLKRVGLRIEGRAVARSGGISLGEDGIRFGPAGAVHLVFGY